MMAHAGLKNTSLAMRIGARFVLSTSVLLGLLTPTARAQIDATASSPSEASAAATTSSIQEVTVTARRVEESVLSVPASISVLGSTELQTLNVQDFGDYALKVPNLSFQFGAGGNGYVNNLQISIRGISGANTTGFYIDDTQVPISINPQVVDVQRIEVLKGPQGTLYGAGSMGGNVRIVTNQPNFTDDYSYTVSAGYTDHAATPDGRGVAVGNLSLVDGVAAIRAVAVVDHQGGWITRTWSDRLPSDYPIPPSPLGCCHSADNQGAVVTYGGSLTLLVKPIDDLAITARFMGQQQEDHGRQEQYAPLPTFEPLDGYTVPREADFQEWAAVGWSLPSLEIVYSPAHWSLTSTTSYFSEIVNDAEDGTEGDLDLIYAFYGLRLPPSCCGHNYTAPASSYIFNQEERVSIEQIGPFRAIFGARYFRDEEHRYFPDVVIPGLVQAGLSSTTDLAYQAAFNSVGIDESVYGETYWDFGKFELTIGARKFVSKTESNPEGTSYQAGWYEGGVVLTPMAYESENGVSPKFALSYKVDKDSLVYANVAKGFRPGGTNGYIPSYCDSGLAEIGLTPSSAATYHSDNLWNYEVGGKTVVGGMLLTAAAFQMNWTGIQQTLIIPICNLGETLNVGDARVRGTEFELDGSPLPRLQVHFGFGYEDPVLLSASKQFPAGTRVLDVPTVTGSIALTYTQPLTSFYKGFVSSDFGYTGDSTSATSGYPSQRGGYGIWNARFGVQWERYELELYAKNILSKEPNLGDLSLESLDQIDPNGSAIPFAIIPPPLQIGVQFMRNF
jgi:outer membrane receptor protein involved in Fe transport